MFKENCNFKYIESYGNKKANLEFDKQLNTWLRFIGDKSIEIPWSAEELSLSCLEDIPAFEEGYVDQDCNKDWIVIGKVIGDPIIYNSKTKEILTSVHGVGKWKWNQISPNIEVFDQVMSVWCDLYSKKYNYNIYDEDFIILESFINDLKTNLLNIMPVIYVDNFLTMVDD